jgi:hypothetical protein
MQPVSETAYLLSIYQCCLNLVKFFFFSESCFSIMVCVPETMIGWAHIYNRWRKALSSAADRLERIAPAASPWQQRLFSREENAWATQ